MYRPADRSGGTRINAISILTCQLAVAVAVEGLPAERVAVCGGTAG